MPTLAPWDSFYVIAGTAAGALIGLQFVVMTLVATRPDRLPSAGRAFATPTIVHFCTVLAISALALAPWPSPAPFAALMGATGIAGTVYALVTGWRMRAQTFYDADVEDWLCHCVLPLVAYATLTAAAFALDAHARDGLFAIAAATLVLLFTAIHNAWDSVAFQVFRGGKGN